jgi:hypothetical protein
MKNIKKAAKAVATAAAMLLATNSWAYTISGGSVDVGSLDTLLGVTTLGNSNPVTETNWINSLLNPDTTFNLKTETVSYQAVDGGGAYAFALQSEPGYYIIKNAKFWAAFQNNASLDWAVFSLAGLPSKINLGGSGQFTISHVSEFGKGAQVPEPTSLGLLAAGMLGLVAARRMTRKA